MPEDGVGRIGRPGHGKGPWDGLESADSALSIHVLQKGVDHGARKYTD
jgi:hypothetical protein